MTDIVERLRKQQHICDQKLPPVLPHEEWLSWGDAADEIERLREENQQIRKSYNRIGNNIPIDFLKQASGSYELAVDAMMIEIIRLRHKLRKASEGEND